MNESDLTRESPREARTKD
ncbi:hypothetical protein TNCT_480351, partial [Trichonephila clavata]